MTFICNISDIPEEQTSDLVLNNKSDTQASCYEKEIDIDGKTKSIFLLKHDGNVKAYINSCPHTGAPLNWQPGVFLDSEKSFILCSVHGAMFEKSTGLCVFGPCVNRHLSAINIKIEDEKIYLK